jgi:hypothetical protein
MALDLKPALVQAPKTLTPLTPSMAAPKPARRRLRGVLMALDAFIALSALARANSQPAPIL